MPSNSPSLSTSPRTVALPHTSRSCFSATAASQPNPFHIFREIPPLRDWRRRVLRSPDERTVGLVPTMGALHAGHFSLIRQAAQENSDVIVSIYLNPTQFAANEDFDSYPKTWDSDLQALRELDEEFAGAELPQSPGSKPYGRISAVFAPTTRTMYPTLPPSSDPQGVGSFVTITPLATLLEGASRPVFFRGVATVCAKLFNIVTPERVYFGQKDVQQTVVIRRLVKDLCIGTEVRVGPTVREEPDGLALSSRNVYLGERRRKVAGTLIRALRTVEERYLTRHGVHRDELLGPALALAKGTAAEQATLRPSKRARFEVDYISLADPDTMEELAEVDPTRGAILSGAIRMLPVEEPASGEDCGLGGGGAAVRLIDNLILPPVVEGGSLDG
ncbi:MAG: hypothetical protein M4579_004370 [Chaenotheca gracillima]|nr:MAG: hypothetical protein M4579_004370 [Chaenotheca gracillima]